MLLASPSLGLWIISTNLYLTGISRRVRASVYGAFRSISHTVFVMFAPAQFPFGNLHACSFCATPGSTVDTCSCSAWRRLLDVLPVFSVKWCSDLAVDSHPAWHAQSWFCWSRHALCCVPFDCRLVDAALVVDIGSGMRWLVLLVLMHVALCG